MTRTFFLLAKSHRQAEQVVDQFRHAGFSPKDISIVYNENMQHHRDLAHEASSQHQQKQGSQQAQEQHPARNWNDVPNIGTLKIANDTYYIAGSFATSLKQAAKGKNGNVIANTLIQAGVPEREAKRIAERLKDTPQFLIAVTTEASKIETARGIADKNNCTETYATPELAAAGRSKSF